VPPWTDIAQAGREVNSTWNGKQPTGNGEMRPGKATGQTYTSGAPDFPGATQVTMSAGGPGVLIDCMKCVECGWSVTEGTDK